MLTSSLAFGQEPLVKAHWKIFIPCDKPLTVVESLAASANIPVPLITDQRPVSDVGMTAANSVESAHSV